GFLANSRGAPCCRATPVCFGNCEGHVGGERTIVIGRAQRASMVPARRHTWPWPRLTVHGGGRFSIGRRLRSAHRMLGGRSRSHSGAAVNAEPFRPRQAFNPDRAAREGARRPPSA